MTFYSCVNRKSWNNKGIVDGRKLEEVLGENHCTIGGERLKETLSRLTMGIGHTINTIEGDWWYSEKPATGFMARKYECLFGLLGLHTLLNRLYKHMVAKWPLRFIYLFSFSCPVSRVLVSCNSRTFSCTEKSVFFLSFHFFLKVRVIYQLVFFPANTKPNKKQQV